MLIPSAHPTVDEFAAATGWKIEPRGACRGEQCVPLDGRGLDGDRVDLAVVTDRLGMGTASDDEHGLVAVGPATFGGRALTDVAAPDLSLPTIDGQRFELGSLRGTKVVLVAWAPY